MSILSASYKSLLMLFEHLQPDFAFIIEQAKPLILLNISLFPTEFQNINLLFISVSKIRKLGCLYSINYSIKWEFSKICLMLIAKIDRLFKIYVCMCMDMYAHICMQTYISICISGFNWVSKLLKCCRICYSSKVLRQAAQAFPQSLLEIKSLRPHPKSTKSKRVF